MYGAKILEKIKLKLYDVIDWGNIKQCRIIHPKTKQNIYIWIKPKEWVKYSFHYDALFEDKWLTTYPWKRTARGKPREIIIDGLYINYVELLKTINKMEVIDNE